MKKYDPWSKTIVPEEANRISGEVVDAALKIHKALGPGLYEKVYEECLCQELAQRNIPFKSQVIMPVHYNGITFPKGFCVDLIVNDQVLVELKSVDRYAPIHKAQIITYLRFSGCPVGLLINFNTTLIKDGIQRLVL